MFSKRLHIPIFIFDDCVDYLQEWYSYAKRFGYTQKQFIADAGIGAQSFLSDILARRKKIGERHIKGIVKALGINADESEYFSLLVQKEIIRKPREKESIFRNLAVLREKNLAAFLDKQNLEYFTSWRYPVIREYVVQKGKVCSPKEIVNDLITLKLTSREVEQALKKLQKWNIITYDTATGAYIPQKSNEIISYDTMPHAVVNDVKRTMIETSIHAMETMEKDKRHVSMAIRGISEEKYQELCRKIDTLRKEFLKLEVNPKDADRIVSMNVQVFPVMTIEQKNRKEREK